MKTLTITATTVERRAAHKEAEANGDEAGMQQNAPWSREASIPESIEEAVELLGAENALALLCQKYVVTLQGDMRNEHAPRSESARERSVLSRLLKVKGVTLAQLEEQLAEAQDAE